jgi:hypothetical protein
MTEYRYYAPRWAIELCELLHVESYDTYHCRLLAVDLLQSQVDCPDGFAHDLVYGSKGVDLIESDTFRKEAIPPFAVGDIVENVSSGYVREYGPKGPVHIGRVTKLHDYLSYGVYVHWEGCRAGYFCYTRDVKPYRP